SRTNQVQGAMKPTLKKDLSSNRTLTVDEARCISFMGREGMVYATPRMVNDVEFTCRDFLLQHLDTGEDSVGTHVSIDHLGATPLGLQVTIEVKVAEIDRRKVIFKFSVKDPVEEVGRGKHGKVSIFVHSASPRRQENQTVLQATWAQWREMLAVNLDAAFAIGQALGRHMVERRLNGRMLVVTSLHAHSRRNLPHYSAAKAGQTMLVK